MSKLRDWWEYSFAWHHYYNIKWFFKNVWRYKNILYNDIRPWEAHGVMVFAKEHLKDVLNSIRDETRYLQEVDDTRLPKEQDIARCIEILGNIEEDNFAERCGYDDDFELEFEPIEDKPGYSRLVDNKNPEQDKNNRRAMLKGRKLEEKENKELMKLLSKWREWWT